MMRIFSMPVLPLPRIAEISLSQLALTAFVVLVGLLALWVAILLSVYLLRRVWRIRWIDSGSRHYLHLRNTGNLPAAMQIRVISPDGQLRFSYMLDGAALSPASGSYLREERLPLAEQPLPAPAYAVSSSTPAPAKTAVEPGTPAQSAVGSAKAVAKSAEGKANAAFGIAGLVAMILGTLGGLLPGSAGRALNQMAAGMQQNVSAARFKVMAPVQKVRQAQRLGDQVDTLKTDVKGQAPVRPPAALAAAATGVESAPAVAVEQSQPRAAARQSEPALRGQGFACDILPLPLMAPETGLTVELRVEPRNRYHSGSYTYWLLAQRTGLTHQPEPEKTVRQVKVRRLPFVYGLLSVVLSAGVLFLNAAWLAALGFWLARLMKTI